MSPPEAAQPPTPYNAGRTAKPCDVLIERLALGEPLAELDAHVATCPACSRLVALPRLVAASAHAAEPNPGFVVRTSAGARTKLAVRRRNRIIGNGLGALAAVAIGVFILRDPGTADNRGPFQASMQPPSPLEPINANRDPRPDEIALTDDEIGAELARIADFDRAVAPSPAWDVALAPLSPYRLIVNEGALR